MYKLLVIILCLNKHSTPLNVSSHRMLQHISIIYILRALLYIAAKNTKVEKEFVRVASISMESSKPSAPTQEMHRKVVSSAKIRLKRGDINSKHMLETSQK